MEYRKSQSEELGRKTIEEFKDAKKMPLILVLDNIRSALNIGSIFRTADAFPVESIFICGISACPPNKEMEKTALGATASVEWKYFEDVSSALINIRERGYKVFAIEQTSNSISLENFAVTQPAPLALILGNEVNGVSEEAIVLCDGVIEIPQEGTKHSLNVAVSAGIVLWEVFKGHKKSR
jgi:23S rRNA (guanosine2251-2'-O)-methyltransferase